MSDKEFQNFFENIRVLRAEKGLSKKEMAKRLRIGLHSLNLLERGVLPPRLDCLILYYIHREFGIRPAELFRGSIERKEQECTAEKDGSKR